MLDRAQGEELHARGSIIQEGITSVLSEAKADGTAIPENAAQHLHKSVIRAFFFFLCVCVCSSPQPTLTSDVHNMLRSIIDPDIEVAKVATTLEWVIPTPPPLHGFAEPPILVLAPDQTAREQRGH